MEQMNAQRTAEELKNAEYNYFICFKIDVKEAEPTTIADAIKTALGSTSGSIFDRRLNELKNDAMEIMCNDAVFENGNYVTNKGGRKKEAEEAVKFKKNEARGIIEALCQTRKMILKSEILDIYEKINNPLSYFSEDDFLKDIFSYLLGLGVRIIDNIDTKIPFHDFEKTEKLLEPFNKKDLYEFLDVDKNASEDAVRAATDQKFKESTKISMTQLKQKQAISSVCGNVKRVLLTNTETRKTYDQYLTLKKDVWDAFAKRKSFGIKEISMEEYEGYTQSAMDLLNISFEEAEKIIAIGCKYHQFIIVGQTKEQLRKRFIFCPYCGKRLGMNQEMFSFCPFCGETI